MWTPINEGLGFRVYARCHADLIGLRVEDQLCFVGLGFRVDVGGPESVREKHDRRFSLVGNDAHV